MLAKKILAGIFAVLILLKLPAFLINPAGWLNLGKVFLAHPAMVTGHLSRIARNNRILIFSSLNLIDMALVMFFTSLLTGLSLMPYSTQMLKAGGGDGAVGLGKAWLSLVIWGAVAVAVLARVFAKRRRPETRS